jgi:hypothetical protein
MTCSVKNCDDPVQARGLCQRHYAQMRKHGRILEKDNHRNKGCTCVVEGCDKPAKTKGYCNKHFQQIWGKGEISKNTIKDLNVVVDKGRYYELILTNKNSEEVGRCKIDKEDLKLVQSYGRWTLTSQGYAHNRHHLGYDVKMHRLVMSAPDDMDVDHKKNDIKYRLDNRKKNLRLATESQNNYNVSKRKDNKSGYKGVSTRISKAGSKNPWQAQIMIENKRIHLGWFKTAKEASRAYEKAAKKAHKQFYRKT